jgi:hypothetical protein
MMGVAPRPGYRMAPLVISLTYLSRTKAPMSQDELEQILAVSRVNNDRDGLTGMLLYADEHFIQTLEGETEAVEAAFERIGRDQRHYNVEIALREEIDQRGFADWSMGFKRLTVPEAAELLGYNDFLDPNSTLYRDSKNLGRAGVFHRVFREFRAAQVR